MKHFFDEMRERFEVEREKRKSQYEEKDFNDDDDWDDDWEDEIYE